MYLLQARSVIGPGKLDLRTGNAVSVNSRWLCKKRHSSQKLTFLHKYKAPSVRYLGGCGSLSCSYVMPGVLTSVTSWSVASPSSLAFGVT